MQLRYHKRKPAVLPDPPAVTLRSATDLLTRTTRDPAVRTAHILPLIKSLLRKAGARSREARVEALGGALEAITFEDTRGFFEHCGYRIVGQRWWGLL